MVATPVFLQDITSCISHDIYAKTSQSNHKEQHDFLENQGRYSVIRVFPLLQRKKMAFTCRATSAALLCARRYGQHILSGKKRNITGCKQIKSEHNKKLLIRNNGKILFVIAVV